MVSIEDFVEGQHSLMIHLDNMKELKKYIPSDEIGIEKEEFIKMLFLSMERNIQGLKLVFQRSNFYDERINPEEIYNENVRLNKKVNFVEKKMIKFVENKGYQIGYLERYITKITKKEK